MTSPAVDAGANALAVDSQGNPLAFDLDGNPRIENGTVDIGAYEYTPPASLPGDLNADGAVNSDDLDIVRANWGRAVDAGSLLDGDPTGDGRVNSDDLDVVRANWGQTAPAGAAESGGSGADAQAATDAAIAAWGDEAPDIDVYGPARERAATLRFARRSFDPRILALANEAWLREREERRC